MAGAGRGPQAQHEGFGLGARSEDTGHKKKPGSAEEETLISLPPIPGVAPIVG